jgi:hypothetical protein
MSSIRRRPARSIAPFEEQCDAVQISTWRFVQYICCYSAEPIRDTEATPWVGPFDILEFVADDSARAAFHTALIRKEDRAVVLWRVAGSRATIDALLTLALEAGFAIDDADMRSGAIDVVRIERQFALDRGGIEDVGTRRRHR